MKYLLGYLFRPQLGHHQALGLRPDDGPVGAKTCSRVNTS